MTCKHCHHDEKKHDCCDENKERKEKIINLSFFIFGLVFLISGFVLEKISGAKDPVPYQEITWSLFKDKGFYTSYAFLSFLLYTIGYIPLLIKILISCIEEMKEGEIFNEFLLMIVATLGAYIINQYPECLFVVLFSIVGEMLEDYATSKSKKSITKLVNNMPLYAHYIDENNRIIEKEPDELKVGDLIEVRPGEKVSVDGTIIKGNSSFDQSSLNGESMPSDKKEGDAVYSGSINLSSLIVLKVEKEYKNSTLSKIMDLVENEQEKKAKSEKLITRFARIYTPIVMLISLLVFLIGFAMSKWDFANGGKDWLYRALSILLISCPCSLVITVPIGFFSGIGSASKLGILIKGSIAMENLSKADTNVFDKTGTLTEGKFVLKNEPNREYLQIAASLENKSTHPLASAIKEANKEELLPVDQLENIPGKGIKGTIDFHTYLIGSLDLLKENNIDTKEVKTPYKVLYLAELNVGQLEAFIVADKLKDQSKEALSDLKKEHSKKNIILSGDEEKIVLAVKDEVNADDALYELLPEEKLTEIKKMKEAKHKVMYVGDGINDSPSLLASDVGIAMGGLGSDAAIEASDIVIMDDNLMKVAEAKRLSKKTLSVVYLGIFLSIFLKILVMVLVSTGVLGNYAMIVSSISDTGVMVICVLNALRMLFYKPKYIKQPKKA